MNMIKKVVLIGVVAATTTLGTAGLAYADTGAHTGMVSASSSVGTNQGPDGGHSESNGVGIGHSESNGVGIGHSESNESSGSTGHSSSTGQSSTGTSSTGASGTSGSGHGR
jgi:hypothetical protein